MRWRPAEAFLVIYNIIDICIINSQSLLSHPNVLLIFRQSKYWAMKSDCAIAGDLQLIFILLALLLTVWRKEMNSKVFFVPCNN